MGGGVCLVPLQPPKGIAGGRQNNSGKRAGLRQRPLRRAIFARRRVEFPPWDMWGVSLFARSAKRDAWFRARGQAGWRDDGAAAMSGGTGRRMGFAAAGAAGLAVIAWAAFQGWSAPPRKPAQPAFAPAPRAAIALAPQVIAGPRVEVMEADFGLFRAGEGGKPRFEPALVVPDVEGEAYGWQVKVKTDKPKVRWREELTLPQAPRTWGDDAPVRSDDGRTAVTEQETAPEDGVIRNVWAIAQGDPKGMYELKLTIEGEPPRTFLFEVR